MTLLAAAAVLTAQGLVEGRPDSAVRVTVYEDLQCPDCAAFRRMMDETLLARYGGRVAFVHRDFPLPRHAWARKAAVAARFLAATRPELGVEWRRHAMASIKRITDANFAEQLSEFARAKGVDPKEALAALEDPRYAQAVEKDYQEGVARGVARTPTVFVNGVPFIETFTVEEISKAIEQALAETR